MDIGAWLHSLGLSEYAQAFRDNDVDAEVLTGLTAEDLASLGVVSVGHRRKLLNAIAALRDGGSADRVDASQRQGKPAVGATPAEAERRQVTVLFADLCGYTVLSRELDAEELHQVMGRFFDAVDQVVESYGGMVDKHIGDCAMAVFGAPTAHGNDAERAVRAALDLHAAMTDLSETLGRTMRVHIGIASGQVVASGTGGAGQRAYTVTGESVNLASRLTDAAQAGEVLIADAVHHAVAHLVDGDPVGEVPVKGLDRPVRTWRVRSLVSRGSGATERPFVGRRAELHQFRGTLAACRETGSGLAVYVRGEAGIGKTRLVEEFRAAAAEQGFACHTGLVLDFGVGKGQDAVRALVRGLLAIPLRGDDDMRRAGAERALAEGLVDAERQVSLNDLLDLAQPAELRALYDAMDSVTRNRGKREVVTELVRRLSARRPLLLIIEDVHWADRLTLDQLAILTAAVAECPAVLVMTSRIEGDPLDHAWRGATESAPLTTIDLGPLRRREAMELAGAFLDANTRFAMDCVERAEGNPLFLEQLLRSAEETAVEAVPGSVQSLVLARMDRLAPVDKRALQAASVLGQRFPLDALRHLIESPHYDCTDLTRHYLVRPEGEDLLFTHALIRDGVYASLLKARARELHRRTAEWFADRDPVLRAEHLDRAEDSAAPRAYLDAARAEAAQYRTERALQLVERGLALARERGDTFALTCFRGEILHDLGRIPASIATYQRALEATADDTERCRAWLGLAAGMRVVDDYDGAFAALAKAEAAASGRRDLVTELAHIHHLRGNLCFPLGRIEECLREHELSRSYAQRAGSAELEARALGGLGDAEFARGRMITAHRYFRRCVELCRAHGFGRVEVANLYMVAETRMFFNDLADALDDALDAAELAARLGHLRAEIIARHVAAFALFDMGDLARAGEHLDRARGLIRSLGARRFEPDNLAYRAKILRVQGHRQQALDLLERAVHISRETGITYSGPLVLGETGINAEDPNARRQALEEGERILRQGGVGDQYLFFYRDAIEAALEADDWDAADCYAAALEDYTRPEPLPWATHFIARGRALAAHGHGRRDHAMVQELRRLRDEAGHVGLHMALPALERALGLG